jgi:hypothetical protein
MGIRAAGVRDAATSARPGDGGGRRPGSPGGWMKAGDPVRVAGRWPGPPGVGTARRAAARSAVRRSPPSPEATCDLKARGLLPVEARPGAMGGQYAPVDSAVDNVGRRRSVAVDAGEQPCAVPDRWIGRTRRTRQDAVHRLWTSDCRPAWPSNLLPGSAGARRAPRPSRFRFLARGRIQHLMYLNHETGAGWIMKLGERAGR